MASIYRQPGTRLQEVGRIATRLKEKKERADYQAGYPRIGEEVPVMLADAQEFAARLGRIPARHPNPKSLRQ